MSSDRTIYFKVCPDCGKESGNDTDTCGNCGHQYRPHPARPPGRPAAASPRSGAAAGEIRYKVLGANNRESPFITRDELLAYTRSGHLLPSTQVYDTATNTWWPAASDPLLGGLMGAASTAPPPVAALPAVPALVSDALARLLRLVRSVRGRR